MDKIYISKSKAADPNKIISVKKIVSTLFPDHGVIEFKGGKYSTAILDLAEIVFVVGPSPIHENEDGTALSSFGRGNFDEAKYALLNNKTVFFIVHHRDQELINYRDLGIVKYTPENNRLVELPENHPKKGYQKSWGYLEMRSPRDYMKVTDFESSQNITTML